MRSALEDFKREMYDGAGVAELQAGLRCLDFLCAKSKLSDALKEDIELALPSLPPPAAPSVGGLKRW